MGNYSFDNFTTPRGLRALGITLFCSFFAVWTTFSFASAAAPTADRFISVGGHGGIHVDGLVIAQSNSQLDTGGIDTQGLTREGIDESGLTKSGMDEQDTTREGLDQSGLSTEGIDQQNMTTEGIDQSGLSSEGVENPALESQGPKVITVPQSD